LIYSFGGFDGLLACDQVEGMHLGLSQFDSFEVLL
jgi:hypothetical protein